VVSTVATPGEWQCKIRTGGVRRLAVANGPNIFQMLLVTESSSCIVLEARGSLSSGFRLNDADATNYFNLRELLRELLAFLPVGEHEAEDYKCVAKPSM